MKQFVLGALTEWFAVGVGEAVRLDVPSSGSRKVAVEFISDSVLSVVAVNSDGESWLVAFGDGHLSTEFALYDNVALMFAAPDGATIFMKTRTGTQVLSESPEATFTDIEPRRMSASDKVSRIRESMAKNAEKRVAVLLQGLEQSARIADEKLVLLESLSKSKDGVSGES